MYEQFVLWLQYVVTDGCGWCLIVCCSTTPYVLLHVLLFSAELYFQVADRMSYCNEVERYACMSNLVYCCNMPSLAVVIRLYVALQRMVALLHVPLFSTILYFDVVDLMSHCNVAELYACWSSCFCLLGTILVRFADLQRCSALLVVTLHVFCLFSCIWAHCASVFYNPPILWQQLLWLFFGIMLCCR